jgi:O-antigen/teichoic acid export membrane protein
LLNVLIFFATLIGSKFLVLLLGGNEMIGAVLILNILAISVPIIAISNVFGVQLLIPFGYSKEFSKVILSSGIIYATQAIFIHLIFGFNLINISIITVTTEIFVTAYMFHQCKKKKLWI